MHEKSFYLMIRQFSYKIVSFILVLQKILKVLLKRLYVLNLPIWLKAMETELKKMQKDGVHELVDIPYSFKSQVTNGYFKQRDIK